MEYYSKHKKNIIVTTRNILVFKIWNTKYVTGVSFSDDSISYFWRIIQVYFSSVANVFDSFRDIKKERIQNTNSGAESEWFHLKLQTYNCDITLKVYIINETVTLSVHNILSHKTS